MSFCGEHSIAGVLSGSTVQTRATVTKCGIQVENVILKTSGDAAIENFHFEYLLSTKNVLCTQKHSLRWSLTGKERRVT